MLWGDLVTAASTGCFDKCGLRCFQHLGPCVHVTTAAYSNQEKFLTPGQSRAARGLLDWSQTRLAKEAGLGLSTVYDFETERREVSAASIGKMQTALEGAGIEFTNGKRPGVRIKG